ncbi:MAG: pyruvate oxidase [Gluconacetobacter diazotrophicus]|nr:pyruvate oxidase [Gluconacetobacter diazotrophicus]
MGSSDTGNGVGRRALLGIIGAAAAAAAPGRGVAAGTAEPEPTPPAPVQDGRTTAAIVVDRLIAWGATHAFGMVGDGIGPLVEALRRRRSEIAFVGVRHEEAAAFMASGFHKHGGRLGVCVATSGPGAVHLLNGLFDAALDGVPVVAVTGSTFHDQEGMRYPQAIDAVQLMRGAAGAFNERVSGPAHAGPVTDRACRAALAIGGVAHLTIAKDVQNWVGDNDLPSVPARPLPPNSTHAAVAAVPTAEQLDAAAAVLNAGRRVAILAGQGCRGAERQLRRVADTLGAPVATSLLGKALLPDGDPLSSGGIGHLGTTPSRWAMRECDTVLILGSTMPWLDYYPDPTRARGVQLDRNAERIGLRWPVEEGLVGEMGPTLDALIPRLRRNADRSFLAAAQERMRDWNALLRRVEARQPGPAMRPQAAVRRWSELAPADAMFSLDCGANTQFAARHVALKPAQGWAACGTLVSMAPGLPLAIGGAFAHPGRPSLAVVGDGGLAMLMAELSTAVMHRLPVKVLVLNNGALGQELWEQRAMGWPNYGCELGAIDFAAAARAMGAAGFRCERGDQLDAAMRAAFAAPGPALVDAVVDPEERPTAPDDLRV